MHQGWEAPKNVVAFYLKLFPDADYRIRQRAWWWAALSGTACMALSPFNFPPFPFAMKRLICCILLLLILRNTYYVGGILRKKTRAYFTGSNFFHFTKKKSLKGTDFRQDCQNTDLLVLELTSCFHGNSFKSNDTKQNSFKISLFLDSLLTWKLVNYLENFLDLPPLEIFFPFQKGNGVGGGSVLHNEVRIRSTISKTTPCAKYCAK